MTGRSKINWGIPAAWLLVLGGYAAASAWVPAGPDHTKFVYVFLCVLPLLINCVLLRNAVTANSRANYFWMLLALGCSLKSAGEFILAYGQIYQHRGLHDPFAGNIVFFLRVVPMIAALAIQPHKRTNAAQVLYGYVDFSLLLCWWLYLYLFVVTPWQYIAVNEPQFQRNYNTLFSFENLVFLAGALVLSAKAKGRWRVIYAYLIGCGVAYLMGDFSVLLGIRLPNGTLIFPSIASLLFLGTAGVFAYSSRNEPGADENEEEKEKRSGLVVRGEGHWASRLARGALLSLPVIGLWCVKVSHAPAAVHQFRILLTLGAVFPMGFLIFLQHELMDAERLRLLRASKESIDNLKRLQMHFVQSEKLASIGQLAAGAAHEINNPLTAILGYSEMLIDDPTVGDRSRSVAEKIRDQARRTTALVSNLLSFARQTPSEQRSLVNVNTIVTSAAQLRRFDLRGKNIRVELQTGTVLPSVRGDSNQLLQVFLNIINNAVDAMLEIEGGTLTVRSLVENGNVVILFSDTGPGLRDARLVFDPFYTTKPVGKGTGLGLSICYGFIQDHGGHITCYNRPEGGATFRIELPAVTETLSTRGNNPPPRSSSTPEI
jgi:signal transduction histidine kinase